MNKSCIFCGNKNLTEKKVQYIYKHNTEYIIVNDVPCLECDFCGEQYFNGDTMEKIEKLYHDISNNKRNIQRKIEVPIEDYSAFS
ncbi:MAG: hypothetical protein HW421_89 [Ignavibacteria bacterium]|nr:hypothetical protein [Ignavibacteria bacterium]